MFYMLQFDTEELACLNRGFLFILFYFYFLILSTDFGWKNSKLMKIRTIEAELFHDDTQTDGRTDLMTIIVDFRNFANAPKS
jgi:hypothetical protein